MLFILEDPDSYHWFGNESKVPWIGTRALKKAFLLAKTLQNRNDLKKRHWFFEIPCQGRVSLVWEGSVGLLRVRGWLWGLPSRRRQGSDVSATVGWSTYSALWGRDDEEDMTRRARRPLEPKGGGKLLAPLPKRLVWLQASSSSSSTAVTQTHIRAKMSPHVKKLFCHEVQRNCCLRFSPYIKAIFKRTDTQCEWRDSNRSGWTSKEESVKNCLLCVRTAT